MAGHWRRRGHLVELRVYVGPDSLTGKQRYRTRSMPFENARHANRELASFVAEIDAGGPGGMVGASKRTVGELLDRWFEMASPDWSPSTAYETRQVIGSKLQGLRHRDLRQLTTGDIDELYAALRSRGGKDGTPLSPATVRRAHGILRLAFDQAVRWDWRPDNPVERARPGRNRPRRIQPPTTDDVLSLLAAAEAMDTDLLAYLFLDAETGARRGEVAALRFSDLDGDSLSIARTLVVGLDTDVDRRRYASHIWPSEVERGRHRTALIEKDCPKNESSIRTITLSTPTVELLTTQQAKLRSAAAAAGAVFPIDGFIFAATVDGSRPLRPDTWSHRFRRLRASVGLDSIRLHDVRHFVATSLLVAGVDLATVAGRLGHGGGGKTTLAIYGHFLRAPDRTASDVMAALLTQRATPGATVTPLRRRTR